jgi:hypothetical protein
MLWETPKVILAGCSKSVMLDGSLHILRKERDPDGWGPSVEPYDPYWPGDEFIDDWRPLRRNASMTDALRRSAYDADLAAKLRALAGRVRRNVALRRDPERFHVDKSCIAQDLEHLADRLDESRFSDYRHRQRRAVEVIGGKRVAAQRQRDPFFTSTR